MSNKISSKRNTNRLASLHQKLWLIVLILLVISNFYLQWQRSYIPHNGETWIVRRVISGQTIEAVLATDDMGVVQRVRLIGISTPLKEQAPWGIASSDRLEQLVKDRKVVFEFDAERKDSFERTLAYVWVGNQLINAQLIAEGHALAETRPPNLKHTAILKRAESEARLLELGIWNPDNPMRTTPKEFRQEFTIMTWILKN